MKSILVTPDRAGLSKQYSLSKSKKNNIENVINSAGKRRGNNHEK